MGSDKNRRVQSERDEWLGPARRKVFTLLTCFVFFNLPHSRLFSVSFSYLC